MRWALCKASRCPTLWRWPLTSFCILPSKYVEDQQSFWGVALSRGTLPRNLRNKTDMGKLTESQENEKEVVKYLQRKKSLPTEG